MTTALPLDSAASLVWNRRSFPMVAPLSLSGNAEYQVMPAENGVDLSLVGSDEGRRLSTLLAVGQIDDG